MTEARPEHKPVLVDSVLEALSPRPGEIVLDGTVGLGGHALAILPHVIPDGRYIGLDIDEQMLAAARERIGAGFAGAAELYAENYAEFPALLERLGVPAVDMMLLDLGVNSAQLDDPLRGFSFDSDGPLDMRFDRRQTKRALDLVNGLGESELADIFYEYGQEGLSRKIARRICQVRHGQRINSTLALARAIESVYASQESGAGRVHPATRAFQALRIAVNRELDNLRTFLEAAPKYLRPGGRVAVISFHSLEDGIVKEQFRTAKAAGQLEDITKRPTIAAPEERGTNPRSRSAKLRAARRVG